MTPLVIHVPKGGLPPRRYPEEPDTPFCRKLRMGIFVFTGVLYTGIVISWLLGWSTFSFTQGFGMGAIGAFTPIMVDRLIRPGKRSVWVWTLCICLSVVLIPFAAAFFVLVFPLGLLATCAIHSARKSRCRSGSPEGPQLSPLVDKC